MKHLAINSDPNDQSGTFISRSCPFLRRTEKQTIYYCAINDTKPFYCKNYPDDGICEHMADLDQESEEEKRSASAPQRRD